MSVMRFDPFRDLDRLSEQLLGSAVGTRRVPRFMPMDLVKSGDHYLLVADLPGVDPGSIDLDVDNGILTIRAERSARSDEGTEWLASERFAGSFMRQVTLGEGIDGEAISAHYEHGVLSVVIPLAEKAKPRKISVSMGNAQSETISGTPESIEN